ncbi:hypothetical protein F5880DRAFT_1510914 [Lentinula raphanica]|nr:hypothetical protein F5880DRAFT_1510914 [Lentinula raphanica]
MLNILSNPRLRSGLRILPNQIFRAIKNRTLDVHCFCHRTASAFCSTKKDNLIYGQYVAKYFINLTEAYEEGAFCHTCRVRCTGNVPKLEPNLDNQEFVTLERLNYREVLLVSYCWIESPYWVLVGVVEEAQVAA